MKLLIILLLFSPTIFAKNGGNFDQKKMRVLQKMRQRKSIIDQGISCVERATGQQMIKSCRQQMKSQAQALKSQRKQRKGRY